VNATVQRNVIVNCDTGIYIGDNYALAPDSCAVINNDIMATTNEGFTTLEPMVGDSVVSNNGLFATTTAAGYTADSAGIYRKTGRGPKVKYLAITDVGHAGDPTDADRTGVAI
jgi:hypothetical protein